MLMDTLTQQQNQDHYAVLGLSKLRYRATEDQIKKAHRKKVLRHHPDKKAAAGALEDDSFFKCIQKANEIMLDPVKRRQYDSVDEGANVEPPSKKETQKGNFYTLWGRVFAAEGRFSTKQPVPKLGNDKSAKADVESFYNFWYNFDSWRSFEYLDEDIPDDNESRDQRRHMERKNTNARKKRKTEDTARLRKLVDTALELDERIKRFKKEEHAQKHKKRLDKEAEAKRAAEEAALKKIEDAKLAAAQEEKDKVDRVEAKKAKEAAKSAAKKNKRVIRGSAKDANYFQDGDASAAQIDSALNDVDALILAQDNEEIAALTAKLNGVKDAKAIKGVFTDEANRLIGAGKLKAGDVKSLAG
jgi:DnaJ homolog subfamily C member 2